MGNDMWPCKCMLENAITNETVEDNSSDIRNLTLVDCQRLLSPPLLLEPRGLLPSLHPFMSRPYTPNGSVHAAKCVVQEPALTTWFDISYLIAGSPHLEPAKRIGPAMMECIYYSTTGEERVEEW